MIHELRAFRQRPFPRFSLNKADLADPVATKTWLDYFNAQPNKAVAISCKKAGEVARVVLCQQLAPHRDSALKPPRLMISGHSATSASRRSWNALAKKKVPRSVTNRR